MIDSNWIELTQNFEAGKLKLLCFRGNVCDGWRFLNVRTQHHFAIVAEYGDGTAEIAIVPTPLHSRFEDVVLPKWWQFRKESTYPMVRGDKCFRVSVEATL